MIMAVLAVWCHQDSMVSCYALTRGTVTLCLHIDRCGYHDGYYDRRVMLMITLEGLIAVISLVLTAFGLGYSIGYKDSQK